MPRATVNTEPERFDLKTLPGGYVVLKPLSFGQLLHRRDQASRMSMEQEVQRTGRRGQRRQRPEQEMQKISFELLQEWTRWYEFSICITEHNLEDETGATLDFSNKMAIRNLDPKIGAEIEELIDELNQEMEEDVDAEPFTSPVSSSQEETKEVTSPIPSLTKS